ncbi:MAG: hypothetical protein Q9191_002181 [Dirinaria sp. TL-2023a]
MSSHSSCPLLDLPLEIRYKIYNLVLPSQDTPPRSALWSTFTDTPKKCMSLLLVNQQVSAEARQLLYGDSSFTIAISLNHLSFLHHSQHMKDFRPFKSTHSISYIKNWQLDLHFEPSYDDYRGGPTWLAPHLRSFLDDYRYYIREALLSVSAILAEQRTALQTLKIRVPCLCHKAEGMPDRRICNATKFSLEPLKRLKFNFNVVIIAARYEFRHDLKEWLPWRVKTADMQCKEKSCLAFTDSFADIIDVLRNQSIPPLSLTPRQKQWLNLKQRSARLLPEISPQIRFNLLRVWTAMERETDENFNKTLDSAIAWIDMQFDEQ